MLTIQGTGRYMQIYNRVMEKEICPFGTVQDDACYLVFQ
jgi:hypothetical protein